MRLLAFILSIIVLTLSILPCADGHDCATDENREECYINNAVKHNSASHDLDLCSPFCHCSCCGGFVLTSPSVTVPTSVATHFRRDFSEFLPQSVREISLPVWQPPQLV